MPPEDTTVEVPPPRVASVLFGTGALDAPAIETLRAPRLAWDGTRACNGHVFTRLDKAGRFLGNAWYAYSPRCGCEKCRQETVRRHVARVDGHGGLLRGLHFVATAPPEADLLDLGRLRDAKAAAAKAAQRATADVLGGESDDYSAMAIVHPQGSRPKVARPHVDGWVTDGPALDRLSDPSVRDAWLACFRERWAKALQRIAEKEIRTPIVFARWYGDRTEALFALRDTLRAMPGWSIRLRLTFVGPWRRVKIERERRPPAFPAGTIPDETVRRADWSRLTQEERRYYEIMRDFGAASLRSGVETPGITRNADGRLTITFTADDIAGVVTPGVARQVEDFDSRLLVQIILAREEIGTLGWMPPDVAEAATTLRGEVERCRTPSSTAQAEWLLDALRFDVRERLPDSPSRVSGLLAPSEVTYLRRVLRDALKAAGLWEMLRLRRKTRREARSCSPERLEVV